MFNKIIIGAKSLVDLKYRLEIRDVKKIVFCS